MINKQQQKKRLLLLLPVLIVPLAVLLFYGFGGGKDSDKPRVSSKGINTVLPDAVEQKVRPLDKLSIYRLAEKDSAKIKEQMSRDPYFSGLRNGTGDNNTLDKKESVLTQKLSLLESQLKTNTPKTATDNSNDYNEYRWPKPLDHDARQSPPGRGGSGRRSSAYNPPAPLPGWVSPPQESTPDPEIAELNRTLDKVLDIQHPERVSAKPNTNMPIRQTLPVVPFVNQTETDLLQSDQEEMIANLHDQSQNNFFEWNDNTAEAEPGHTAILATIDESKSIVSGSVIKLRLEQDISIRNMSIPAGTGLFGTAQLQAARLRINIQNIQYNHQVLPVNLEVFSYDGIAGIPLSESVTQEVTRQGLDRSIQSVRLTNLDPSIGAQAATAGIETAKTLLSRKARIIKIPITAGYPVLLQNTHQ